MNYALSLVLCLFSILPAIADEPKLIEMKNFESLAIKNYPKGVQQTVPDKWLGFIDGEEEVDGYLLQINDVTGIDAKNSTVKLNSVVLPVMKRRLSYNYKDDALVKFVSHILEKGFGKVKREEGDDILFSSLQYFEKKTLLSELTKDAQDKDEVYLGGLLISYSLTGNDIYPPTEGSVGYWNGGNAPKPKYDVKANILASIEKILSDPNTEASQREFAEQLKENLSSK